MSNGNISGSSFSHLKRFFNDTTILSAQIPLQIFPGKQERDNVNFYQFVKNDGFDHEKGVDSYHREDLVYNAGENFYKFQMADTLFIVFNSYEIGFNELNRFLDIIRNTKAKESVTRIVILENQPLYKKSRFIRDKIIPVLAESNKPILYINSGNREGYEYGYLKGTEVSWLKIGDDDSPAESSSFKVIKTGKTGNFALLDFNLVDASYVIKIYNGENLIEKVRSWEG